MMQWHQFLVEIESESIGRVLKLDYIKGDKWRGIDLLVFDSYHWWHYHKPQQPYVYKHISIGAFISYRLVSYSCVGYNVELKMYVCRWDYMQVGRKTYQNLDRKVAFKIALEHWAGWIDQNIDPAKTKVFYQGISPSHYGR